MGVTDVCAGETVGLRTCREGRGAFQVGDGTAGDGFGGLAKLA